MDSRSIRKTRQFRSKLVAAGLTYARFAHLHGYNARSVKAAVRGERAGHLSQKILAALATLR